MHCKNKTRGLKVLLLRTKYSNLVMMMINIIIIMLLIITLIINTISII